ncbi:TPA: DUF1542 domain-containing protein, partial [Streptococcus pyogenes]
KQKVNDSLKGSDSLKSLRETVEKASSKNQKKPESFEDVYVPGNEETEKTKVRDILQKTYQKTEQNIETDPWLSPEQKKAQKENAKTRLDAGLKAVETTESLDKLKEVESDFLDKEKNPDSIPNQHKAGTPEVARKTFLDNFEKEAKKEIESIKNDVTLTDAEKATAKAKVEAQLQEAKGKAKESKSFDDLKNIQDKFNSELPHTPGKPLKDQQSDAIAELEKKQQEIEKAIEGDKTLPRDEKEKQIADSKERLKSDTQKVKDAKNADAIKKVFEEGKVNIPQAHIPGDLNKDKEKLLAELKQKAADTEKAIDSDKTLTAKEKEEQKAKTKEELQKATEAVGAIDNREELDKKVPELKKAIEDTHVKGNLEGVKNKAIEDLKKVHDETVAKINGDDTLDKATKEAQVKEADKAYGDGVTAIENAHVIGKGIEARKDLAKKDLAEAVAKTKALIIEDKTLTDDQRKEQLSGVDTEYAKGIENIDAAKDAAGVDKAYSDGVRDILAQYKEGQNLDDRRNAAKEFLLKEADKVTKLINDDPTLTHDQKVDQINKVEQAKLDAIKSVDDAQTADAINDALGKGIENINNQYQHGDGVDVRKATAKGDLEKEAAKVKALIAKDPTLTQADKDKQTAAVDAAKNTAIAAVDKATTADGVNQELGKGITAINKAYRPGEGVKARKEAA